MKIIFLLTLAAILQIVFSHNLKQNRQQKQELKQKRTNHVDKKFVRLLKPAQSHDQSLPLPHTFHELGHNSHRVDVRSNYSHARRVLESRTDLLPLYPGYGTHFAYVYVGTPPQRQSVIVDTGSHFTAFPCTGCSQCGQHTDAYWDLKNSSTAAVPKCNGQPCVFSQSYSEGSSWRAFKVTDKFYVGAIIEDMVPAAKSFAVDYTFGCQTFETGLFRTQLADGIMGMGQAEDSFQELLVRQKVTTSKVFSLCYRVGGGIMTLGGVDQRVHLKPTVNYTPLKPGSGWYGVIVSDIYLQEQNNPGKVLRLNESMAKFNDGKGSIVDSGTTDTYLPLAIATKFKAAWQQISGIPFSTANIALTAAQLAKIPDIVFKFQEWSDKSGEPPKFFTVTMPMASYIDNVGGGKYALRIYLTEGQGAVLGANFMNGINVIFDGDQGRIGFAKSLCKFESFMAPISHPPSRQPISSPGSPTRSPVLSCGQVALTDCSATCDASSKPFLAVGQQDFTDSCISGAGIQTVPCHVPCAESRVVRGNASCPDRAWTPCDKGCLQSRMVPIDPAYVKPAGSCQYTQQTRTCYSGICPLDPGDFLVFLDMRVRIEPDRWSYVYSEAFYGALAMVFQVDEGSVVLLNDIAGTEYTLGSKLHFQIRVEKKFFKTIKDLNDAASAIAEDAWEEGFGADLIDALKLVSKKNDRLDHDRFGYLLPEDIEVLNAMALPISDVRDPIEIDNEGGEIEVHYSHAVRNQLDLLLLGVILGCLLLVGCTCGVHQKLRAEHAALSKEKNVDGSLYKFWSKLTTQQRDSFKYKQVQLTEASPFTNESAAAIRAGDNDNDDDDDNDLIEDLNDNP